MPVRLQLVRLAQCAQCGHEWILGPSDWPKQCEQCRSVLWLWGPDENSRMSRAIRHGRAKVDKTLNPGAKSLKRRERARKQWRQMKPKPEEP